MNMKRICCIISLFALCLTFNQAHAQRCLPGMKGLQVTGGMADGVHWNSKSDFAYYFGAAMSTCKPFIPGKHLCACAWLKVRHSTKRDIIQHILFMFI